ncbi:MAG: DUF2079 domain-containing protein [bacterium]|nr:DUF2079 domain-containing protein [bacterium]
MRDRFLWIAVALYAALFTWLGALRFAVHRNFVDFGIFAQTAASAFGCFCNAIEGSHWAFHFSPILYVAGAVVWLWHSPLALVALQALAGALAIPPIYGIIERRAGAGPARMGAIVVALYPALAGTIFNDFHENGFAPAAVAWMLWAFDGGMLGASFAFALVTLAVKEDQAIFLAIAGGLGAWRYRGERAGRVALVVALLSLAVLALFFLVVQPHAAANPLWSPTRFYAWTAQDLRALVPGGILARLGFIALAFVPLLFLPFRSRMMWLAAAPLAEVLLSRMPTTFTMGSHYAGAWLGYAFVAFAFAVRELPQPRVTRALWWCIGLCVVELAVANPLHPGMNLRVREARDARLDSVLAALPRGISIATQEEAYTHLALADPFARLLPEDPSVPTDACFILTDAAYPDSPRLQEYGAAVDALVREGAYVPIFARDGIALFRTTGLCR